MSNYYKTAEQQREYMKDYYINNKERLREYEKLRYHKNKLNADEWVSKYYEYLKKHEMGLFKIDRKIPEQPLRRFDKGKKIKTLSKNLKTTVISFN